MTTHIALLRGINVGGHKPVPMAELRALLTRLGLADVRTLLQSGNAVFRSDAHSGAALERLLEEAVEEHMGVAAAVVVRTAKEWRRIVRENPFPDAAERDPGHLLVMCCKARLEPRDVAALQRTITGREVVHATGQELYAIYPDGAGRSRLTNTLIEKTLGTRGTARNWNTVLKLARAVAE